MKKEPINIDIQINHHVCTAIWATVCYVAFRKTVTHLKGR